MKIKFELKAKTDTELKIIMSRIYSELDSTYQTTNDTKNKITFRYNTWRVGSRSESRRKIDGGTFKVETLNGENEVQLYYFISFLWEFLIVVLLLILGFAQNSFVLFLIIPIPILLLIRIDSVKKITEEMMSRITK